MILDTDMSRHFEIIGRFKARSENLGDLSFDNSEDKLSILAMALKVADLGHAAKSTDLHDKWTNLVMEEYFRQGDLEKEMKLPVSIYCDRMTTDIPRCQAGFLKIVCIPMFDIWCSFIKSEQLRSTLMPQLRKNLRFWEEKGKFRSSMIYTDAKIKEVIETSKMSLEFFTEDPIMSSPGL